MISSMPGGATTGDLMVMCSGAASNPATFTVVNTLDSGAGSLRQAILDAALRLSVDTGRRVRVCRHCNEQLEVRT